MSDKPSVNCIRSSTFAARHSPYQRLRIAAAALLCGVAWAFSSGAGVNKNELNPSVAPPASSAPAAPAAQDAKPDLPPRLEFPDDPYLPNPGGPDGVSPRGVVQVGPYISVQVNVNAQGNNILGDAGNEPSIAIDPTNPQRIAITWRQFDTIASNFRQGGYAYSTNGGAIWTFPGVIEPGVFNSDPCLAVDSTGRFFWASLHSSLCMSVWQSSNAGQSWPITVAAYGGDKEWLTVDRTGGIGNGNLYCAWQTALCSSNPPGGGQFTRSIDHGNSWLSPITIPNQPIFGVVAVGPDGAVYVTGRSPASSSTFIVAKSSNAQNPVVTPTWDFSVTGNFLGGNQVLNGGPNPGGLLGQVWITVNPSNASHVYLLCSVNPPTTDPLDVMFSRSTNGGTTWSTPVKINSDAATANGWQWFGTMSVAPNGRIDVIWNDTRTSQNAVLSELYYAYSVNGGLNWSVNIPISPQFNSTIGWPNQNKIGDYYHTISDNAAVSIAYAATFNGEQDVYFLHVGDCNNNGIHDGIDIANGTSLDLNGNGIPDECEGGPLPCPADITGNGTVDVNDLLAVINSWGACPQPCPPYCPADVNHDCAVDVNDLLGVINAWGPCP